MDLELRDQIVEEINKWIDPKNNDRSANKLAEKSGVNAAYISRIRNGEYSFVSSNGRVSSISDVHFFRLAEAIGMKLGDEFKWEMLASYKQAYKLFRKSQRKQLRACLDGDSGQGKTFAQKWYGRENDYVVHVECTRNLTPRGLINLLCDKLGIDLPASRSPYERLEIIKKAITNRRGYVLLFDQVGKNEVKPSIYGVLMDIAVAIEGKAGMVVCGYKISEMLTYMYEQHQPGYRQLARRFIHNRYELPGLQPGEIASVCESEGISNKGAQNIFKQYVKDVDQLVQWVRDVRDWQRENNALITGEQVIAMFNVKSLMAA